MPSIGSSFGLLITGWITLHPLLRFGLAGSCSWPLLRLGLAGSCDLYQRYSRYYPLRRSLPGIEDGAEGRAGLLLPPRALEHRLLLRGGGGVVGAGRAGGDH